jgi:PAS domain S-box-containing protein
MIEGMALHELVLDALGQPQDYRILDVNPAFEGHTGMQRQAIVGRLASEAYGVPQAPFLAQFAQVAQSGQPQVFDQFFQPLGKHFLISVFSPERLQFVTVFEDITERKRLEHELRDSEQRFRLLLEHTPSIAVQGYDAQRRVIFWNQASEQLYGYSAAEALGRQLEDLIIPDAMRQDVIAATQAWMNGGPAIPARRAHTAPQGWFGRAGVLQPCHADGPQRAGDVLPGHRPAGAQAGRSRTGTPPPAPGRTGAGTHAGPGPSHGQRAAQRAALSSTRATPRATPSGTGTCSTGTSWLNPAYSAMLGYAPADLDERLRHQFFANCCTRRTATHPGEDAPAVAAARFLRAGVPPAVPGRALQVAAQPRQGRRARRTGPRLACGGHPHRPERAQAHGAGTAPCAAGGRGGHACPRVPSWPT